MTSHVSEKSFDKSFARICPLSPSVDGVSSSVGSKMGGEVEEIRRFNSS